MRISSLVLGASLVLGVTALAQSEKKSRRTAAEALKQKGLELKKYIDVDVNGDGKKELIAAGLGEKGLRIVVVGEDKEGAVVTDQLPWALGKEIAKFEPLALAPPKEAMEVLLEVYDETPDEKVKRVRVYAFNDGKMKEIFTNVLNRPKNSSEREAWETDKSIITFGDARRGWYFDDLEEDGVGEVLVRRKPQILSIEKDGEDPVKLMTGVREQVWRFDTASFSYKDSGERLNDFLPVYEIEKVTASSAWIEPNKLKELKANALSEALNKEDAAAKAGKEGSPGGELELGLEDLETPAATPKKAPPKKAPPASTTTTKPSKKKAEPEPEPEPEIEIDRSEFMAFAADRDLATAWIEDAPDDGKGQWVEVELAEEAPIHMVRVVAGCVDTAQSYKAHNVPEVFKVQIDGGSEAEINRREPTKFDSPAVAFSDGLYKSKTRPWMKTTLVFFDGKTEGKKVRITLDKSVKQGKGNHTCISEISVH